MKTDIGYKIDIFFYNVNIKTQIMFAKHQKTTTSTSLNKKKPQPNKYTFCPIPQQEAYKIQMAWKKYKSSLKQPVDKYSTALDGTRALNDNYDHKCSQYKRPPAKNFLLRMFGYQFPHQCPHCARSCDT